MELDQHIDKNLEYKWKDVTFKVKPHANSGDRLKAALCDGRNLAQYFLVLVECFVVDWEGVTLNGQPVPYSFKLLAENFPSTAGDNALLGLADFIWDKTDIAKGLGKEVKKK